MPLDSIVTSVLNGPQELAEMLDKYPGKVVEENCKVLTMFNPE